MLARLQGLSIVSAPVSTTAEAAANHEVTKRWPSVPRMHRSRLFCIPVAIALGVLLLVAEPVSGHEPPTPSLPPNTDCTQYAVVAKLAVTEDRAAANMLAEAIDHNYGSRCLLNAFADQLPSLQQSTVFVVGGPAAVSDSVLARHGVTSAARIWGADRWATQAKVAQAVFALGRDGKLPSTEPLPVTEPSSGAVPSADITISAGLRHTCGVLSDHTVVCWGNNFWGQSEVPEGQFTAVAAGTFFSCGLRTDRTVTCWGGVVSSDGDVVFDVSKTPSGEFTAITAGSNHACGLRADRSAVCWGSNTGGKATPPSGKFIAISAGDSHSCAIRTDGAAACWGHWYSIPDEAHAPAGTFTAVTSGQSAACGLRDDRTVMCWGVATYSRNSPGARTPDGEFAAVSGGRQHRCGIRTDRTAVCWGPSLFHPPDQLSAIAASSGGHTCGIRTDGTAVCWGPNSQGQSSPPSETFLVAN